MVTGPAQHTQHTITRYQRAQEYAPTPLVAVLTHKYPANPADWY
jgi:hypothetical protein